MGTRARLGAGESAAAVRLPAPRSLANSAARSAALRVRVEPAGFGRTQTGVSPTGTDCGPTLARGCPKAARYAVTPRIASQRGRMLSARAIDRCPPALSSAVLSSSARAVARATTLVMPSPRAGSRSCSSGRSWRSVNPDACSAGRTCSWPGEVVPGGSRVQARVDTGRTAHATAVRRRQVIVAPWPPPVPPASAASAASARRPQSRRPRRQGQGPAVLGETGDQA